MVARFGLVVDLLSHANAIPADLHDTHRLADAFGIALVIIGAVAVLGALHNYRLLVRSLSQADVPAVGFPWLASFLALSVGIVGMLLSLYLALA